VARYEAEIDLTNPNVSHTQVIELVGRDKSVLDVGCAGGAVARELTRQGCRVTGVDFDAESAEPAREFLDQLVIADLNVARLSEHFKPGAFDVIVFADVLEHLLDPVAVLRDSLGLLAGGGRVVISIPNAAHGSVRLALLQGRWDYSETGLLDATHIKFFTRRTFLAMLDEAGLFVEHLRSTVADPLTVEVKVEADHVLPTVIDWVRHQPSAMDYQFVAAARPATDPQEVGRHPDLLPAVPYDDVRQHDRYTEQMRVEQDYRHRMLRMKDHVIGLEAAVAAAQEREARAMARARKVTRNARRLRRQLKRLKARAAEAEQKPGLFRRVSRGTSK
jgi:2-polyprenyl-3-methyl-5-hydroxy-6-metoxy-1,4-benzoquinol methylase